MEAYTTMTINFNNNEAANKAMDIIKAALKTITPKFPTEFIKFEKDITVEENEIIVDESCSLWQAIGRVDILAKEVATKLADEDFTLDCYYYSCNCGYKESVKADYSNGKLTINTVFSEDDGYCPECGELIVRFDEYDSNAHYYCPECGEELDHEEMFEDGLPTFTKEIIKIK